MASNSTSARSRQDSDGRSARSLVLPAALLASVVWHLFVFSWASGAITVPSMRTEQPRVVTTELLPVAAPARVAPVAPVARAPKRKPRPRPAPSSTPPATDTAAAVPATAEASGTQTESNPAPAGMETAASPMPAVEPAPPDTAATDTVRFDLPPPAELKYDVQAFREGKQWYGSGVFRWEASGNSYSITGEASVTFLFKITVLNFRSEGTVNAFGIAPVLYSEKPWRKAMTNTHFQHEHRKISFSASQAVYPYHGGEQDRASIMWQLAAIGRGDPARFSPGAAFDIVVAGARDADTWRVEVAGLEDIDTPKGRLQAWHVVRAPRPGSYDQKIDIWLVPQLEWYPARVRFTYPNGDHLELTLAELSRAAQASSPAGSSSGME